MSAEHALCMYAHDSVPGLLSAFTIATAPHKKEKLAIIRQPPCQPSGHESPKGLS